MCLWLTCRTSRLCRSRAIFSGERTAGATSLLHEAKVDVVTVPNLSEHLSSAETTEQLSARFASAAAMKSINNLLLGDGEGWSRQSVDLGGSRAGRPAQGGGGGR